MKDRRIYVHARARARTLAHSHVAHLKSSLKRCVRACVCVYPSVGACGCVPIYFLLHYLPTSRHNSVLYSRRDVPVSLHTHLGMVCASHPAAALVCSCHCVVRCMLHVECRSLHVVCCDGVRRNAAVPLLHVRCCTVHAAFRVLDLASCMLHAVCCTLSFHVAAPAWRFRAVTCEWNAKITPAASASA